MQTKRRALHTSWIGMVTFLVMIGLAACGTTQTTSGTPAASARTISQQGSTLNSQQRLTLHFDGYRQEIRTPAQMCGWTLVAETNVTGVGQGYWNTPGSTRPNDLSRKTALRNGYRIYTPMKLTFLHIYIDARRQPTHDFAFDGGQVGADRMSMEDYPQVTSGHYLMVFAPTMMAEQKGYDTARLTLYSAFPINSQGLVQLQPQIVEQGQVSQKEVDMPLSQVAQQLSTCK